VEHILWLKIATYCAKKAPINFLITNVHFPYSISIWTDHSHAMCIKNIMGIQWGTHCSCTMEPQVEFTSSYVWVDAAFCSKKMQSVVESETSAKTLSTPSSSIPSLLITLWPPHLSYFFMNCSMRNTWQITSNWNKTSRHVICGKSKLNHCMVVSPLHDLVRRSLVYPHQDWVH
jgi:hypothetical protein